MKSLKKAYLAGTLTHADQKIKKTYETISQVCNNAGIETYVPHVWGSDPKINPEVEAKEVWKINQREIAVSNLFIAFVGEPSLGVGAEIEIARITMSYVVLWWYTGQKVSKMTLGNPAVKETIEAEDDQDLVKKLKVILNKKYEE